MKPIPIAILIVLALALGGCDGNRTHPSRRRDDAKAAQIARLKVEMERCVREARDEHALRAARLRTIRITAFVIFTGGAVTWFIVIHQQARSWPTGQSITTTASARPRWFDYILPTSGQGRVIELPPPEPSTETPTETPTDSSSVSIERHPPEPRRSRRNRRGRRHPQHHPTQ